MRILSYGTPVFLLFFCALIRCNTEGGGGGGGGYPDITFQFPAEAHSVIPSVNFLIKTVNIWWSWTRTNLLPNFLPVAALWENEKTLGTRLGESPQYPGGGGGTATYRLYRYVPLWRVWFSSRLLCVRVRDTNQNQDPSGTSPPKNS